MHRIAVHSASVLFVQFPTIESSAVFPPPLDCGEILAKQYERVNQQVPILGYFLYLGHDAPSQAFSATLLATAS